MTIKLRIKDFVGQDMGAIPSANKVQNPYNLGMEAKYAGNLLKAGLNPMELLALKASNYAETSVLKEADNVLFQD